MRTRGGERLHRWLQARDESQYALAERIGVSGGLINGLIAGRMKCSLEVAIRISNETGLPVRLFTDKEASRTLKLYVERQNLHCQSPKEIDNVV